MDEHPDVRFASSSGVNIAYSRWGVGEDVVVFTPPWVSNLELQWEIEEQARVMRHGGEHHQVVLIDKRGVGLSDRTNIAPTLEERVADTLAVLDAEALDRVTLAGASEGGAVALALAARHPDRVEKLVLIAPALPGVASSEFRPYVEVGDPEPLGLRPLRETVEAWGTGHSPSLRYFGPDVADDPRVQAWMHRFERQSASPGALVAHLEAALAGDISEDIGQIECPTMISHCIGDLVVPAACSRYLAARMHHATLVLWDDANHAFFYSHRWREIHDTLIEFITGTKPAPARSARFAAVLFTDIVDSTAQAGALGDDGWARLIRAHDSAADRVIARYGGRRVKSTGDGLLAVFDDPGDAVGCAIELRAEMGVLGLRLRGGLHAGQIESQPDGDVAGLAVNVAARIEAVGSPEDICVSGTVRDLLLGTSTRFEPLGTPTLKGLDHPIEVLRVVG